MKLSKDGKGLMDISVTGQPIAPDEFRELLDSSEAIDLTAVSDFTSIAETLR